jgi:hypothetical protein
MWWRFRPHLQPIYVKKGNAMPAESEIFDPALRDIIINAKIQAIPPASIPELFLISAGALNRSSRSGSLFVDIDHEQDGDFRRTGFGFTDRQFEICSPGFSSKYMQLFDSGIAAAYSSVEEIEHEEGTWATSFVVMCWEDTYALLRQKAIQFAVGASLALTPETNDSFTNELVRYCTAANEAGYLGPDPFPEDE